MYICIYIYIYVFFFHVLLAPNKALGSCLFHVGMSIQTINCKTFPRVRRRQHLFEVVGHITVM